MASQSTGSVRDLAPIPATATASGFNHFVWTPKKHLMHNIILSQ